MATKTTKSTISNLFLFGQIPNGDFRLMSITFETFSLGDVHIWFRVKSFGDCFFFWASPSCCCFCVGSSRCSNLVCSISYFYLCKYMHELYTSVVKRISNQMRLANSRAQNSRYGIRFMMNWILRKIYAFSGTNPTKSHQWAPLKFE